MAEKANFLARKNKDAQVEIILNQEHSRFGLDR
jgi:hypothetical protein